MKTLCDKIFLIVILLTLINCKSQNLKCEDFKTGTFEFINEKNNEKYILKRNDDYQSEEVYDLISNKSKSNSNRVLKISWKDVCEYKLTLDTIKSQYDEVDLNMNSKGGLDNKILEIKNRCAIIESSIGNQKMTSTICKK